MKSFIDFVYAFLVAVGVVLFVGLGIWTFYSGPKAPQFPQTPYIYKEPTADQQKLLDKQQQQFDNDMKAYNDKQKPYNRNVSIISLVAGVIFFTGGVLLTKRNDLVGEGLALGGVFTGIQSVIRSIEASSKPLVFINACLILAMLILLSVFRRRLQTKRS